MCGIAGVVSFNDSPPDRDLLVRMLGFIGHRGPDAFGIHLDRNAGLAHSRLSIIDLSGGDQPIHNEDGSVWITYNGEVFNYPDLYEKLQALGHTFYTRTDTEVLVHLYEEFGTEMFGHLNGQYAFAIWDQRKRSLLLGRDRLGVRPLFYYQRPGSLTFGSEIKAIFADSRISRSLNLEALSDVFTCWAPLGPLTAFEKIFQIPPGNYAIFSEDGLSIQPYWQLSFSPSQERERSLEDWCEELHDLIHDAIRIRLRADVPVGAYLSGGLDSSFITSVVKRSFDNKLCTFSVSFAESRFDESQFQQRAIRALKTDHRVIQCTNDQIGESFPKVIWHTELPILRTAPGPLLRLAQLVRESDFKVVLTGEGSDEIFAGYDIFKEDWVRRYWAGKPDSTTRPRLLRKLYPDIFSQAANKRAGAFLENFFGKGLTNLDSPAYSHAIRWDNTSQLKAFFSEEIRAKIQDGVEFQDRFRAQLPEDFMSWDFLSRAQYTEISIFLSNYLLSSQGDRMAMAHGIEGRFPFLDHRVVEFAAKMPPSYRLCGLKDKLILRKIASSYLPPEMAQRPKQPYRAPISPCFLEPEPKEYVRELLSESNIKKTGYFDPQRVNSLLRKCLKQKGQILSERESMAIVGILSTQLLDRLFLADFPLVPERMPEPGAVRNYVYP